MNLKVMFNLFLCFSSASIGHCEVVPSLGVFADYRSMPISVFCTPENGIGMTKTEVEKAVKLRLLANKLNPTDLVNSSSHCLKVDVCLSKGGTAFYLTAYLMKSASSYGANANNSLLLGSMIIPSQNTYDVLGNSTSKSFIIENLNKVLDNFLLDYLESNRVRVMIDYVQKDRFFKREKEFAIGRNVSALQRARDANDTEAVEEIKSLIIYEAEKKGPQLSLP